jgi:hypothetical protein
LIDRFRKYLSQLTIQRFQLLIPPESPGPIPLEMVAEYAAGSIIGLINWWLENDLPISPEKFAHQTLLLTANGTYWAAGINPAKTERE